MQVDWELSKTFVSDSQGIRAVCVLPPSDPNVDSYRIVTGNQGGGLCELDNTLKRRKLQNTCGSPKDGSLVSRLFGSSLEPHVREPDVLCDRTLWPSGGLAHGRAPALPQLRLAAALAADRGDEKGKSWPSL